LTPLTWAAAWAAAVVTAMTLDALWFGLIAGRFYRRHIGAIMADHLGWAAAMAFYVLFGGGLLYFCVDPALRSGSPGYAALNGAALGLLIYGTYDLTNLAVLSDWDGKVAAADVLWGVFFSSATACAAYGAGSVVSA
jgi:uncharacterized membrane protein